MEDNNLSEMIRSYQTYEEYRGNKNIDVKTYVKYVNKL